LKQEIEFIEPAPRSLNGTTPSIGNVELAKQIRALELAKQIWKSWHFFQFVSHFVPNLLMELMNRARA
jgi:hypothetical protein